MSFMMELLKKIYPLRLAPVSEDADKAGEILRGTLPFETHEYRSGEEHNGWVVPKKWKAVKAEIREGKKLIYDGMTHPLGVIGYSVSYKGEVGMGELKDHLFYHPALHDALVYHCDYYYKQWKKDWGMSVPYNLFKILKSDKYFVDIETLFEEGTMKVHDYLLAGEREDTIILNAHSCHAGQANDDVAGIVVAIETMRRLKAREKRKYSYRIVIAPEHLGTVFYLARLPDDIVNTFKYAIFLEMLGNDNRFALQGSFTGNALIDKAAEVYLRNNFEDHQRKGFREIVGNDETVWEGAGYEIPCISLSRWPYREYHSNLDDESIISEARLEESVNAVMGIIDILETNSTVKRHFKGLIALSNPKYDLYLPTVDPSIRAGVRPDQRKWNHFMDCVPRYFDQKMTILEMALKHDLNYSDVYGYLKKFEAKQLISFD